jgi:NADH:ubiquinone oxidoreductase subunit E
MIHINSALAVEEGVEVGGKVKDVLIELITVIHIVAAQMKVPSDAVIEILANIQKEKGEEIKNALIANTEELEDE